MTVYFYGRNSDVESFDRQSSIQTQLSKCQSYANIKDLKIDVEITEQVSGTTCFERRIKGSELMSYLKRGDHIICSYRCLSIEKLTVIFLVADVRLCGTYEFFLVLH